MSPYTLKPDPFFIRLFVQEFSSPEAELSCVGFDDGAWRAKGFINYLFSWLTDYALDDEELRSFNHATGWQQMREAAARVYTTENSDKRGEIGEIALHAICRQHFDTVPLVPRVFYLSGTNEIVKGFDLVHYKAPEQGLIEIWLGESKFYKDKDRAIVDAISSVREHMEHSFLKRDKLLIGPQIPKNIPRYNEVRALFRDSTPIDKLKGRVVIPIGILAESQAVASHDSHSAQYKMDVKAELAKLHSIVANSGNFEGVSVILIYVPVKCKAEIVDMFDGKLKVIQDG